MFIVYRLFLFYFYPPIRACLCMGSQRNPLGVGSGLSPMCAVCSPIGAGCRVPGAWFGLVTDFCSPQSYRCRVPGVGCRVPVLPFMVYPLFSTFYVIPFMFYLLCFTLQTLAFMSYPAFKSYPLCPTIYVLTFMPYHSRLAIYDLSFISYPFFFFLILVIIPRPM